MEKTLTLSLKEIWNRWFPAKPQKRQKRRLKIEVPPPVIESPEDLARNLIQAKRLVAERRKRNAARDE